MARYAYDDFRVTFDRQPGSDADYVVHAFSHGTVRDGHFRVPMSNEQLESTILAAARVRSRRAGTRDVAVDGLADDSAAGTDAERLGGALAAALFTDEIGAGYDTALAAVQRRRDRGLRLTLSLGATPELLSLPWELLFRRPTFLAVQPHLPLVRHLDIGRAIEPRPIDKVVRILGVVSSPTDMTPLDVAAEKRRIGQATAKVRELRRVEIDWLDTATPRALRQALQDDQYHVLHYVGHSAFITRADGSGEGVLFLEHAEDRRAVAVDSTMLANLLSNQAQLQLVVLNSCEGARTTLTDPYAGVATTLIQLGVPAVIAMQFEISDEAAILFADELYTNLVGRQVSIDAAVAEARRAIYIEVNQIEWATPVLFLQDPETELFVFELAPAELPPPRPPIPPTDGDGDGDGGPPGIGSDRRTGRRRALGLAGLAAAAALVGATVLLWPDGEESAPAPSTAPASVPGTSPATGGSTASSAPPATTTAAPTTTGTPTVPPPRLGSGSYAVAVNEADGESHVFAVDAATGATTNVAPRPGVVDSQPVWDLLDDRLAFTRRPERDESRTKVLYMRPGGSAGSWQKQDLISPTAGSWDHSPAWSADGSLWFASTNGCDPAPGCVSSLRRAVFGVDPDGSGWLDALAARPEVVADDLSGVRAVAGHPTDADQVAVVDDDGLEVLAAGERVIAPGSGGTMAAAYTPDGIWLVGVVQATDQSRVTVWSSDSSELAGSVSLTALLRAALDAAPTDAVRALIEEALRGGALPVRSVAPGADDSRVIVLLGDASRSSLVMELWISGGRPQVLAVSALPPDVTALGDPAALAFSTNSE